MKCTFSAASGQSARKAARDDRRWFARNPKRSHRIRRAAPDEFAPYPHPAPDGWEAATVVRQYAPGARLRVPFSVGRFDTWPAGEAAVHALFEMILESYRTGEDVAIPAEYVEQQAAAFEAAGGVQ